MTPRDVKKPMATSVKNIDRDRIEMFAKRHTTKKFKKKKSADFN